MGFQSLVASDISQKFSFRPLTYRKCNQSNFAHLSGVVRCVIGLHVIVVTTPYRYW